MGMEDVIGPASNSLAATLGGSSVPKAPVEHKAVEKAEGVSPNKVTPLVLFKRGDIVKDVAKELKVTVLKPYIAKGSFNGVPIHEVAHVKSGERWLQWETNLQK